MWYIADLLEVQGDPTDQALQTRRVLYFNKDWLKTVFRYYASGRTDDLEASTILPSPNPRNKDGLTGDEFMPLWKFWRLVKQSGGVGRGCSLASVDRIFVMGRYKIADTPRRQAADRERAEREGAERGVDTDEEATTPRTEGEGESQVDSVRGPLGEQVDPEMEAGDAPEGAISIKYQGGDPHNRDLQMALFDFFETMIRWSWLYFSSQKDMPLSERFSSLIAMFKPRLMRKITARETLEWMDPEVEAVFARHRKAMMKIHAYFINSAEAKGSKKELICRDDRVLSFNQLLTGFERIGIYDPNFAVKKSGYLYREVTKDDTVMPQEHSSNQLSEMILDEFEQILVRVSKLKAPPKTKVSVACQQFIEVTLIPEAARHVPGRLTL